MLPHIVSLPHCVFVSLISTPLKLTRHLAHGSFIHSHSKLHQPSPAALQPPQPGSTLWPTFASQVWRGPWGSKLRPAHRCSDLCWCFLLTCSFIKLLRRLRYTCFNKCLKVYRCSITGVLHWSECGLAPENNCDEASLTKSQLKVWVVAVLRRSGQPFIQVKLGKFSRLLHNQDSNWLPSRWLPTHKIGLNWLLSTF